MHRQNVCLSVYVHKWCKQAQGMCVSWDGRMVWSQLCNVVVHRQMLASTTAIPLLTHSSSHSHPHI